MTQRLLIHKYCLENESHRDKRWVCPFTHYPTEEQPQLIDFGGPNATEQFTCSWPHYAVIVWFIQLPYSDSMLRGPLLSMIQLSMLEKNAWVLVRQVFNLWLHFSCKQVIWHSGFISLMNMVNLSPPERDGSALSAHNIRLTDWLN